MHQAHHLHIAYSVYDTLEDISTELDKKLCVASQEALELSYSPYSQFKVGAAALLDNDMIIKGANQENVAYSVCICAERTLLSTIASLYPNHLIKAMAVTYKNILQPEQQDIISPCGVCRQALIEYEARYNTNIRLFMYHTKNKIIELNTAKDLLPFAFDTTFLR